MSPAFYVVGILGIALLMVVHESGHFLAARRFGMRVTRFSIGFGPRIFKHQPKGSDTTFQIALIPFLAYVQIAGMNPYEDNDPNDKGSYQNASLWARVVTIAAGPLANYFFASVLFFAGLVISGIPDTESMRIATNPDGPAHAAGMQDGDKVTAVNGQATPTWKELTKAVSAHPGETIDITVERGGAPLHVMVTPRAKGEKDEGRIMIGPAMRSVTLKEATVLSLTEPAEVVVDTVVGIARWITGREKMKPAGPVGMAEMAAAAAKSGAGDYFKFLAVLSAYLGAFNLFPVPALDGGRLLFLGFEAASRKKPDAKVEAHIHAVGLLMLLCVIGFVTYYFDITKH